VISRILFVVIASCLLVSCGKSESISYEISVEIETPLGVRKGIAVRKIMHRFPPNLPSIGESKARLEMVGEAVVVDLGDQPSVYALLVGRDRSRQQSNWGMWALLHEQNPGIGDSIELWPNSPKTSAPRFEDLVPMFVMFTDEGVPETVTEVDPDDMSEVFGAGTRLKRISVKETNKRPTDGIERRLPWLDNYPERRLDRDYKVSSSPTLPQWLWNLDFKR